jgi:nucleoid-associated protein YgaU
MKKKYFVLQMLILTLLVVSCQLEVPTKEMAKARKMINRAIEVKAEKYDKENLEKAKNSLYLCHDYIVKEEEEKKAKAEAIKSEKTALDAIRKSLPLLSADTLKEAKKVKEEGIKLNTEVFSKKKYEALVESIKKSEDLNSKKEYWESHLESLNAIKIGKEIIQIALNIIPELQEKLKTMDKLNNDLKLNSFHKVADGELNTVTIMLKKIEQFINEKDLKSAFPDLEKVGGILNIAKVKIEDEEAKAKIKCEAKITEVEKLYEELVKEDKDKKFDEILQKSKEILIEARNTLDEKKYELSMQNANDAELLLSSTSITIKNEYAKKEEIKKEEIKKDDEEVIKEDTIEENNIAEEKEVKPVYYTVEYRKKNTDCLWRIAKKVYKDAKLWPLIYKANKDIIKDPDLIFPGQKFVIPALPSKEIKKLEEENIEDKNHDNLKKEEKKDNNDKINKESEDFDDIDDIENIDNDMNKL